MTSRKTGMIAGFCHECHSDVQLVNRIYSCRCGKTSDESYDFPPSWVFKFSAARAQPPLLYKVAQAGLAANGRT